MAKWLRLCLYSLFLVGAASFLCSGSQGSLRIFSVSVKTINVLRSSRGSRSALFSTSLMGVVLMARTMALSATFWTLSSLLLLAFEVIAQEAVILHNGMDCSCVDPSQDFCVSSQVVPASYFRRPSFLTDLAATASRCVFHVSNVTPRKVGLSTYCAGMSSIFSITFYFTVESEKRIACVLLQLISTHHSFAQELTLLMVSCLTCVAVDVCSAEVHAARSSACREFVTLGGRVLTMSFTYRRNRVGERTLPCGTPSFSLSSLLSDPSNFTLTILWWRKLLILLYIWPETPA